jgi:hypothetical protein
MRRCGASTFTLTFQLSAAEIELLNAATLDWCR